MQQMRARALYLSSSSQLGRVLLQTIVDLETWTELFYCDECYAPLNEYVNSFIKTLRLQLKRSNSRNEYTQASTFYTNYLSDFTYSTDLKNLIPNTTPVT